MAVKKVSAREKFDKVILGNSEDCVFSTNTEETGVNNNRIVVGGSGSGKTVSILEPIILETYHKSLIASVTKRRIVNKYIPLMKKRKYDVWDIDFVHPERGNVGYDPLNFIKNYQDITFIAKSMVLSNPRKERSNADPYWDDAATSLLAAIITYVLQTMEEPTFADVLEMLDNLKYEEYGGHIRTNYDGRFERIEKKDPSNFAVVNYKNFTNIPMKTASCVFGTLNASLASVFSPELRKMFRISKKVDFKHLAEKKTALFITTSAVNPSLNCFINMFYGHAFKELFEYGEEQPDGILPVPVELAADDFATGCPVPMFDQYISIFREKRISVTILVQSESQLSSIYGENETTTIINNCDTYIYMGSNDLCTARNISQRVNLPLEDVLHMKLGKQILFRRGAKPKIGQRYQIFENELYKKVTKEYENKIAKEKEMRAI